MASQFSSMSEAKHLRVTINFSLTHPVCNHLQILYRHLHYRTRIWPFPFPSLPLHTHTHTHTHHNQLEYCQRIMYKRSPCCHSWSPTVYPQHIPQSDLLTNKSRHITPQFKALHAYVCAQSCPILCHPMNCSLTGSSVHGVFQARIMQWVAIFFSRRSSQSRDQTHVSCVSCIGRQFIYQLSHQGPSLPN